MRRRWSTTSKVFGILAVLLGAASFLIVHAMAARLEAVRPALGASVPIVVAGTDLDRGQPLTPPMLATTMVPSAFAPPGAVADGGALQGRTLLTDVAAGEPITRTRIADRRSGPVAALVQPGFRAVTVGSGLPSNAVRPGDRVDVLATYGGDRPHTETVASEVEVLLVMAGEPSDAGLAGEPAASPSLALLVTPEDAERLAYAQAFADLSVSVQAAVPSAPA
jgi:pilus assembly protein CpaB